MTGIPTALPDLFCGCRHRAKDWVRNLWLGGLTCRVLRLDGTKAMPDLVDQVMAGSITLSAKIGTKALSQ